MTAVARKTDKVGAYTLTSGSPTTYVDGLSVARVTDTVSDGGTMVQGSATVFVDGHAVCRVGDLDTLGHAVSNGSPTFFIGS